MKHWTTAEDAVLVEMWEAGDLIPAIAGKLWRTPASVKCRILKERARLGLKSGSQRYDDKAKRALETLAEKRCPKCNETKAVDAFFVRADKRGFASWCKACEGAQKVAKYAADPEPIKARAHAYRRLNIDAVRARENARAVTESNLERRRKHRAENLEATRERERRYRAKNPISHRNSVRLRRKRLNTAGAITDREWKVIVKRQRGRCLNCKKKAKLTIDHIVPLSQGGSVMAHNVQGLCHRCNSRKGAKIASGTQHSLFEQRAA